MDREETIARIKAHEHELRAGGISTLTLFGSIARGEGRADSDIDLLCEIDASRSVSLLDFIGLQQQLEDILGAHVDLVERECLIPAIARHARRDMVAIF